MTIPLNQTPALAAAAAAELSLLPPTCVNIMQVGQPVGVQSLNQGSNEWYGRSPDYGMGMRGCKHLEPQFQVCAPACSHSPALCVGAA